MMMKIPVCFFLPLFCAFLASGCVSSPDRTASPPTMPRPPETIKLDVPYEPSSEEVVEIMLAMAKVAADDIVYDLGCGDGRIVIAASQRSGVRGVGVDLDPERIRESRENARKANVADRIQFFQKDLFQIDIRPATVVMLYLYPEVNLRLRPKLFQELRPGTRVVSHSHDMGTWEPDQTRTAPNGHRIHFWVIPANVSGTWEWDLPGEKQSYGLRIHQQFQKVSGMLQAGSQEIPVQNLELIGDRVQFTIEGRSNGQAQARRFSGRVQGHLLEGTVVEMTSNPRKERSWKATRNPSSMQPLDR
jgi:SAM-dependent methyltransferase